MLLAVPLLLGALAGCNQTDPELLDRLAKAEATANRAEAAAKRAEAVAGKPKTSGWATETPAPVTEEPVNPEIGPDDPLPPPTPEEQEAVANMGHS
jgi:hypothetical protein